MCLLGKGQHSWLLLFLCIACLPLYAQLPPGFVRQRIASGLNPTSITIAPDGSLFLTEKHGQVRIIRDDQLLPEPFLTIEVDDSNERGLGHMAFHPDYEVNGFIYVYYSVPGQRHNRISRFTANGDKIIPGSEHVILDLDRLGSDVHNGGAMVFGEDGFLYVATGDGAEPWNGEDIGSTYGKILRMDDEGNAVPDNPYYHDTYKQSKYMYAYGLRNPFTIALHPESGDLYVNDVGWERFEEVNLIKRNGYYGWPTIEGKRTNQSVPDNYEDPVFAYSHSGGYCCIVGAAIYAPEEKQFPPQYHGKYFYCDYCTGNMHVLNLQTKQNEGIFLGDGDRVIDIDVTPDGNMYYLERQGIADGSGHDNLSTTEGTLWKVSYTGTGIPFISEQPQSVLLAQGDEASFSVKASGGLPLTFAWYVNDQLVEESGKPTFSIPSVTVDQDSALISVDVKNEFGLVTSASAVLRVLADTRPQAIIASPIEQTKYKAGDVISFSGFGMDPEDGMLPDSQISWRIDFHHGTHAHPAMAWISGITHGTYTIPTTGETSEAVFYRIYLRATDQSGLTQVNYRDVYPHVGDIAVTSRPVGLKINLDGFPIETPYAFEGVQGMVRYISPPQKQVYGDSIYFFKHWVDGSTTANRLIKTADQDQLFEAIYESIPKGKGTGLTATIYSNANWEPPADTTMLDSMVNHNYLFGPPVPGMVEDFYSILWEGYLLPLRTGWYEIVAHADDGVILTIDSAVILETYEAGWKRIADSVFLESGRLYSIVLQYYEETWGAQMKLRWRSADFAEEPIPTSQLFPADYLSKPTPESFKHVATLIGNDFFFESETSRETAAVLKLIDALGRTMFASEIDLPVGKGLIHYPVGEIPPGLYWLSVDYVNGQPGVFIPVVKAN